MVEIPKLKNSEDAVEFGWKATKEQANQLLKNYETTYRQLFEEREKDPNSANLMILITETHLIREALLAYAEKFNEKIMAAKYGKEWNRSDDIERAGKVSRETRQSKILDKLLRDLSRGTQIDQKTMAKTLRQAYVETRLGEIAQKQIKAILSRTIERVSKEFHRNKGLEGQDRKYYRVVAKSQGSIKEYHHEISAPSHLQDAELLKNLQEQAREYLKTIHEFRGVKKIEVAIVSLKEKGLDPEKGPIKGR